MIAYGETKRRFKIHDFDKCCVCSEKNIIKKRARHQAKKEIQMEVVRLDEEPVSKTGKA